ncbi:MAG: ATP-binding protein, partial [Dolichospermum sp.]
MVQIHENCCKWCNFLFLNQDHENGKESTKIKIEKRVDVDAVFHSRQELLELAQASGGHVRQLMQMMRSACLTASTKKHPKILAEDVT